MLFRSVKADFEMFRGDRENRYTEQAKVVSEDSLYGRILNPNIETGVFWSWIANWAGIYKRSFLVKNQIKHNETPGASFQDQGFWFQVYAFAERAFFLPEVFYKYRQDNPNSSMLSKNKVFCIADEYSFIYQVMSKKKKKFIPLIPIYIKRKFDQYLSNYDRLEEEYRIPFLHRFSKDFWEHKKNGELDLKYFNYKEKKALSMIIDSPELYPIMYEAEVKSFNAMLENKNI